MKKFSKYYPFLISSIMVIAGILAYSFGIPFLEFMELKTVDLLFLSRGNQKPDPNIVLAVIDEKSIAKEGKWIWPRSKIANLITTLSESGAKVIAFDIGFLEPDRNSRQVFHAIDEIRNKLRNEQTRIEDSFLDNLKKESDYDGMLAQAIKDSKAKVVLGYFFHMMKEDVPGLTEEERRIHIENISDSRYKLVIAKPPEAIKIAKNAFAPQSNIAEIAKQTPFCGYFNMMPDPRDGVVHAIPAVIRLDDSLYPPLSLQAVGVSLNAQLSMSLDEYGVKSVKVGNINVPVNESGDILINYRGPQKTYPHISITDILNKNVASDLFRDKIVLVGATATAIYDMRVTPLDKQFPGLEIHANVIDNVLNQNFLYRPDWMIFFDILAIISFGILLGIILPQRGVFGGAAFAIFIFSGHIAICQYLFRKGLMLNLTYPLFVAILIYVGITTYRYFTESRQKKFIKDAFSFYLAPSVVAQLIESPEKLVLGGEERNITAFFSDVQGFTSISEKLEPKELVQLLNEFLTEMTDIILKNEGTVDKFEGDAIIALFGAPLELENHALTACKACIDMQKRLAELRERWKSQGRPELRMRIGLCTGPAVVGNMGSRTRMDYTMMGDTVNIAARLEAVNKLYGTYTVIGESTYRAIANAGFLTRELDEIYVVGKKKPVRIYHLMGYAAEASEQIREAFSFYEKGLAAYREKKWDQAAEFFHQTLNLLPQDGPSLAMVERCEEFKLKLPSDWNGIFSMTSKI